jgi:hypothetical protein
MESACLVLVSHPNPASSFAPPLCSSRDMCSQRNWSPKGSPRLEPGLSELMQLSTGSSACHQPVPLLHSQARGSSQSLPWSGEPQAIGVPPANNRPGSSPQTPVINLRPAGPCVGVCRELLQPLLLGAAKELISLSSRTLNFSLRRPRHLHTSRILSSSFSYFLNTLFPVVFCTRPALPVQTQPPIPL